MTLGIEKTFSGKLILIAAFILVSLSIVWQPQHLWIGLLVILFLCWRFYCIRSKSLLLILGIVFALFAGRWIFLKQNLRLITTCSEVVIAADGYKINGDLLSGIGQTQDQRLFVSAIIASERQKKQLQSNNQALKISLKDVELNQISPATNWHEFDFQKWAVHRGVRQQVSAKITELKVIDRHYPSSFVQHLRKKFLNSLVNSPKYCAFHLRTLVAGYSDRADLEIRQLLSTLGIIHLFALSGLHVDLVIRSCRWLGTRLRIVDEVTRLFLLLLLPLYAIFVGLQIGILRAVLTYFLREILTHCHIKIASLDQFSIVLLVCLWLQPAALLEIGPQLSFLLALVLRIMPKQLSWRQRQLRLGYFSMLLILFWTSTFNLLALLMGAVFAPLFTFLILPVTLITLVFPASCVLIEPLWRTLYQLLNWLTKILPLQITLGQLPVIYTCCLIVLALIVVERLTISHYSILILVLPLVLVYGYYHLGITNKVTVIDVGQGDSILVQTAFPKRTMLIDTGGRLSFGEAQVWQARQKSTRVEQITIPYLRSQGIDRLDYVLLSHQDADHIGDLANLLEKFSVKNIIYTQGMTDNPQFATKLTSANPKMKLLPQLSGSSLIDHRLNCQFVAPQQSGIGANEDSLAVLITLNQQKWLFTGDLDQAGEREIMATYPNLQADYLKVGHHGSKTSSAPEFIAQVRPRLAVISAGRNNRYRHPNQETLATLERYQVPYVNTAHYGMIEWYYQPLIKQFRIRTKLVGNEQISGQ